MLPLVFRVSSTTLSWAISSGGSTSTWPKLVWRKTKYVSVSTWTTRWPTTPATAGTPKPKPPTYVLKAVKYSLACKRHCPGVSWFIIRLLACRAGLKLWAAPTAHAMTSHVTHGLPRSPWLLRNLWRNPYPWSEAFGIILLTGIGSNLTRFFLINYVLNCVTQSRQRGAVWAEQGSHRQRIQERREAGHGVPRGVRWVLYHRSGEASQRERVRIGFILR